MGKLASSEDIELALSKSAMAPSWFLDSGRNWPQTTTHGHYTGKFLPGQLVKVLPAKSSTSSKRFKNWLGREGIVVGWQRSGGIYGGQSEYKVFCPEMGKSRWIWAEMLEEF